MRLIDADALVDRLSEEAKRLAEKAIHSKGQAVDYYTGMKTGMAKAAILVNGMLTGEPTVDAEWMLKHGMIQDADFPAIDAAPTIEPKKGKWMEENRRPKSWAFYCSECKRTAYDPQNHHNSLPKRCRYAFCPNCGAKMERSEDG